ncbi:Uma2 family endonuclease [Ancylothrix sp. C2]|uniref:Uma2 family endonuclease n=1 Tax=Ancylothrix sp. D3o TaxID=2953691 RepID=UPI0021BADE23|nr:Uma2 family endonuclease [Ancylothrix sp. D3o]MCT7949379.1 Uma2 family endonuclease [Ancylothrix sp. D3o]
MMSSITQLQMSLAEFLQLPETKPASEYIAGQIYQKPMPQGKHSILQTRLVTAINQVGEPQQLIYALTELRCTFAGRSLVPDIAVFEWSRIPVDEDGEISNKVEIAPDWIIEILSPEQSPNRVINKIIFSLKHGTKLGWFIDPDDKSVMVFLPNQLPEVKYDADILPVLRVTQNWQFSAADVLKLLKFK